jgi:uncharacterized protein
MDRRVLCRAPALLCLIVVAALVAACGSSTAQPPPPTISPFSTSTFPPTTVPRSIPILPPSANTATVLVNTAGFDISQLVQTVESSARAYWMTAFAEARIPSPVLSYVSVPAGKEIQSACREAAGDPFTEAPGQSDMPAFFCTSDRTVYVSLSWLENRVRLLHTNQNAGGFVVGGDFGVATVIAHETGHAIQYALGIRDPDSNSVEPIELQADCFAGLWANSEYYKGHLDSYDIPDAAAALAEAGSYEYLSSNFHGTPAQRRSAFLTGYNSGRFDACTLTLGSSLGG